MGECRNQELILFSEFSRSLRRTRRWRSCSLDPRFPNGPFATRFGLEGLNPGTECGAPAGLRAGRVRDPLMTNGLESPVVQAGL